MESNGDSPPFWTQTPTFFHRQRRRQPPSSPIINPVALIFLIPILALLVLFFLLPPIFSHVSQFLRPNSVKKSWDSISVLLVVFAILCGVFARKNDDVSGPRNEDVVLEDRGNVGSDFEYSDPKVYSSDPVAVTGTGISRLRRSSSSYPDLRQVSAWEMEDNRFRFYDDFEVNFYRSTAAEYDRHRPRWSKEDPVKVIPVDTVKVRSSPPETSSPVPNPPPPPPPSQKKLKRRRSLNSVPRKEILDMQKDETAAVFVENIPPPPPPPPPPPAVREQFPAEKPPKLQRKKSGARNEIETAIASFYNQKKRKQRSKPRNIYETAPTAEHSPVPPQKPPPPPPPPPPPSKVFHNLFKKSGKSKRVHSVSSNAPPLPPPPPPPPPPKSILNNLFKTSGKSNLSNYSKFGHSFLKTGNISRRFNFKSPNYASAPSPPSYYHQTSNQSPSTARKPPLPAKNPSGYYDENLNSGTQSPLIPAPPPPLPFRMPEMSFVPRGDFVRILSNHSSRCSSPELEDVDVMSVKSEQIDGEDVIGPSVCPSPDVNVKAETFIAGLRDKWRMEKINSLRTKGKLG